MQQTGYQLEVKHLSFARSDQNIFSDLSFKVTQGMVLQIVGDNGVGKTTLLRIVSGLIPVAQGEILWCGSDIRHCTHEYYDQLAYLGHQSGMSPSLTLLENCRLIATLHSTPDASIHQLLTQFNLAAQAHVAVAHLSAGQRRRVALVCLLLRRSKLWILDEPLAALDQDGVNLVAMLLTDHIQRGGLTLMTTHQSFTLANIPVQRLELRYG